MRSSVLKLHKPGNGQIRPVTFSYRLRECSHLHTLPTTFAVKEENQHLPECSKGIECSEEARLLSRVKLNFYWCDFRRTAHHPRIGHYTMTKAHRCAAFQGTNQLFIVPSCRPTLRGVVLPRGIPQRSCHRASVCTSVSVRMSGCQKSPS